MYYKKTVEEIVRELETDRKNGLTKRESKERLEKYGANDLPQAKRKSILQILFSQINNALSYILILAIILSLFANHSIDAIIITILLGMNVVIGFYHEMKAEKRMESLKKLVVRKTTVIRNGVEKIINSKNLVPGDLVLLRDGQNVPADMRIVKASNASVVESSLTGESLAVEKKETTIDKDTALGDRKNMLYMGTSLMTGSCKGIVVRTGESTELGQISKKLKEIDVEKTLFQKRTEKLLKKMVIISMVITVIAIVLLYIQDTSIETVASFSFATIVSGIPESLPSVLTILLSIASFRMAKRNALLRNQPSIETLSTVTTIVTDKTGTLTQNIMEVSELLLANGKKVQISGNGWSDEGEFLEDGKAFDPNDSKELQKILRYNAIGAEGDAQENGKGFDLTGSPTEIARYVMSKKAGITKDKAKEKYEVLDHQPYNQETKYKVHLIKNKKDSSKLLVLVGGAENVLKLSKNRNKNLTEYVNTSASKGYRMQALAIKKTSADKIEKAKLSNFELLTILRISDPIRENVKDAVQKARKAGVKTIMATGDHPATAFSIAKQAGIINENANFQELKKHVLSQSDIDKMAEEEFKKKVLTTKVFARVTPTTKLNIADILQEEGEVIAMTGDGVNDAPALKKADIGISMGRIGTDVAKEASDLILLDDSFATIIDAIEEGRTVFANVRQTSLFLIITNLAEDIMILFSLVMRYPLPLLPLQILWLNLVTDGLSDIALATEKPHSNTLDKKPVKKDENVIRTIDWELAVFLSAIMAVISLAFFYFFKHENLDKARTMAFITMVFTQLFNLINMRSIDIPVMKIGFFSNKAINVSLIVSLLLAFVILYIPSLAQIFSFTSLSLTEVLISLGASSGILIMGEVYKWRVMRKKPRPKSL